MTLRYFALLPLAAFALGGCRSSPDATDIGSPIPRVPLSSLPRHRRIAELERAVKAVLSAPAPAISELNTSATPNFEAPSPDSTAGRYLSYLKPNKPKHSLLILEPQNTPKDPFYAGCARWMRLHGAGSLAFDSGTTWGMPDDVRQDRKWESLALEQGRAVQLGRAVDVSCVAIGSVQNGKLIYEVLDVSAMPSRVLGTFSISGNKAQIVGGLPKLTRQIAAAAGAANLTLPVAVGISDADLAFLGTLPFHHTVKTPFTDTERAHLALLATKPLAAMFLARAGGATEKAAEQGAETLLALAPSNAGAAAELATYWGIETPKLTAALRALDAKYPRHFCVAVGNAVLRSQEQDYFANVHYAEIAVRTAPDSAFAWYLLADAISDQADQARQGKTYNAMSYAQRSQVEKMYPLALAAAWKATQLEPGDATYWETLSVAATFSSNSEWARDALAQSLKIDPSDDEALNWGIQIFQPKWFGDDASYAKMARIAVENARGDGLNAKELCVGLRQTNQESLKRALMQILLKHEPNNVLALVEYSYALRMETGSSTASYPLAKRAVQLAPNSVYALQELGDIEQHDRAEYPQAITHLQRAANLDPRNGVLWVNLALPYAKSGQRVKAREMAVKGHALGYDGPHPAWNMVGLGPDGSEPKALTEARPASP